MQQMNRDFDTGVGRRQESFWKYFGKGKS